MGGDSHGAPASGADGDAAAAAALVPRINFDPEKVRPYLEKIFEFLAARFGSDHWKLDQTESDMLAGPTAELLGGVWTKLLAFLPDAITTVPGLAGFIFAAAVVVGPKIGKQATIRRTYRRGEPAPDFVHSNGPRPVPPRPKADPVDPATGFPLPKDDMEGG